TAVEVWEAARQEVCRTAAGPPGAGGVWTAHFAPDDRLLAFLCGDGSAHLWDWCAGREIVSWPIGPASSVHVHPHGSGLTAGARRGCARAPGGGRGGRGRPGGGARPAATPGRGGARPGLPVPRRADPCLGQGERL